MRYTTTDETPRTAQTTQPGGVHRVGFESTLPPEARSELETRRRTRTPSRSLSAPQPRRWRIPAVLALAGALAAALVIWTVQQPPARSTSSPAALPALVAQPTPAAAPAVQPTPAVQPPPVAGWHDGQAIGRAGTIPEVRRAELVQLPAPKAELISIPVGGSLWLTLPYGEHVWVTYCGKVSSFAGLPSVGRFFGETWVAADSNIPWVWTRPPGGVAQWVDP